MLNEYEKELYHTYDANDLAKYIVNKCVVENRPISNLQLQKILYFIQYNYLRNFVRPAFYNKIEAWKYGPVVPDVYEKYTFMGGNVIINKYDINPLSIFEIEEENILVDDITETCRAVDPWALVRKVHKKGGPWQLVYEEGKRNEITIENIYRYIQETT